MTLQQKVDADLKQAMREKNEAALRALRSIKSAIMLALTEKGRQEGLSEDAELKLLQKLAKQRNESIEIYQQQDREDLASKEKEELQVIQKYLPQQLSEEELKSAIAEIIKETNAQSIKDMGKVMGVASKKLAGKAEGKRISDIVKQTLA